MATLLTEATDLAAELHDSALIPLCKKWLNRSLAIILSKRPDWSFLEAQGELITVADQAAYTYATDFGNADLRKVTSLRTDDEQNIRLVTIDEIERYNVSTGQPRMAAEWAGTLRLYPTPPDVRTITWRGWIRQAELGDSDEPPFESVYLPVWRLGAEAMGLKYLDDARASQYFASFFYQLSDMFGDNGVEDEQIVLENYSFNSNRRTFGVNVNDGSVWP